MAMNVGSDSGEDEVVSAINTCLLYTSDAADE